MTIIFLHLGLIIPYTINQLESQSCDPETVEKIAYMLQEWCKLQDPMMNATRQIVLTIIEKNLYTPK